MSTQKELWRKMGLMWNQDIRAAPVVVCAWPSQILRRQSFWDKQFLSDPSLPLSVTDSLNPVIETFKVWLLLMSIVTQSGLNKLWNPAIPRIKYMEKKDIINQKP